MSRIFMHYYSKGQLERWQPRGYFHERAHLAVTVPNDSTHGALLGNAVVSARTL